MSTNTSSTSLVLGLVSGLIGGVCGALIFSSDPGTEPAPPAEVELSQADLDGLEQRIVDRLTPQLQSAAVSREAAQTIDPSALRLALADLLDSNPEMRAGIDIGDLTPSEEAVAVEVAFPGPEEFVKMISELPMDSAEAQNLWKQAKELGLTEAMLAEFDARVEAAPNDPAVQLDGARAYLAAARTDPTRQDPGWWQRSDELYASTLELDPNHWDARMEKAVTLTFWPAVTGRGKEAMGHFETLIEQAEKLPAEERHVDAYEMLGNMHLQAGNEAKAREVWSRGLKRHPGHAGLTSRMGQK